MPLTEDRAKPAVPFGGTYRLIDFVLSNLVNAGMRQIAVLTQYKSHSLDRHISLTWRMSTLLGNYVTPVPAQQRLGPRWYQGSADAIYQSLNLINDEDPDYVVVFGADNIYRMDVAQMLAGAHRRRARRTVAGIRVPRSQASSLRRDRRRRRQQDRGVPGEAGRPARAARRPGVVLRLDGQLHLHQRGPHRGAGQRRGVEDSRHDMGGDIIPSFVERGEVRSTTSPPTRCRAAPTRTRPTGGTSEPSTPTTRRTWTWSRSTRCSTSTTWTGRSGPIRCRCRARSSPWTGVDRLDRQPRLHRLRRGRSTTRCCRRTSG